MIYEKYLEVLVQSSCEILSKMTGKRVRSLGVETLDKELCDFIEGKAIEYTHAETGEPGYFILGFHAIDMARAVAADIAHGMGLEVGREYNETCSEILSEFLNIVVGRTVTGWDHQGFPVHFSQPVPLALLDGNKYRDTALQRRLITLNMGVQEISLLVTFSAPAATAHPGARILVVDDSPITRKILTRSLSRLGYTLEEAVNGREAVIIYRTFQPRLTIMDLVMPELMGLEAIAQIRQFNPDARFLILSSSARRDEVLQARELGVMDYMLKPIDIDILRARVEKALA